MEFKLFSSMEFHKSRFVVCFWIKVKELSFLSFMRTFSFYFEEIIIEILVGFLKDLNVFALIVMDFSGRFDFLLIFFWLLRLIREFGQV